VHPAEYGWWAGAFDSGQLLEMRAALAATMPARLRDGGAAVIVADRANLELAALPHTEHGRRVDSLVVERACFSANLFTCNVHRLNLKSWRLCLTRSTGAKSTAWSSDMRLLARQPPDSCSETGCPVLLASAARPGCRLSCFCPKDLRKLFEKN